MSPSQLASIAENPCTTAWPIAVTNCSTMLIIGRMLYNSDASRRESHRISQMELATSSDNQQPHYVNSTRTHKHARTRANIQTHTNTHVHTDTLDWFVTHWVCQCIGSCETGARSANEPLATTVWTRLAGVVGEPANSDGLNGHVTAGAWLKQIARDQTLQ